MDNGHAERLQIAQTILEQLGGRRFIVMTGAKNLVALSDSPALRGGLGFTLPAGGCFTRDRINRVFIELTPADLYRVRVFKRGTGPMPHELPGRDGVYCDQLRAAFTELTGLETSLGTMQAG